MTSKNVQINVSTEQLRLIIRALDLFSRIGSGQLEAIDTLLRMDPALKVKNIDNELARIKMQVFELQLHANHSINSSKVANTYKNAYDILQVLQHALDWNSNPDTNCSVLKYPPQQKGSLPLCSAAFVEKSRITFNILQADNSRFIFEATQPLQLANEQFQRFELQHNSTEYKVFLLHPNNEVIHGRTIEGKFEKDAYAEATRTLLSLHNSQNK